MPNANKCPDVWLPACLRHRCRGNPLWLPSCLCAWMDEVQGRHRGLPLRHPLPSISRMYGYSPAYDIVVGQVAHFNLTPEASLCRGLYLLPSVLSGSTEEPDLHTLGFSLPQNGVVETFGQIVCSVRRLPIRFMVGTGGTIRGGTIRRSEGIRLFLPYD